MFVQISLKILPSGSADVAVMVIQKVVDDESVVARLAGLASEPATGVKKHLQNLWPDQSESPANNTDAMMVLMKKEEIKGFIAVGVNPIRLYPDREFAAEGLERVDFMMACDLFETETTALADVVLPMCSWAEYDGEYVNLEGRIQTAQRAVKPLNEAKPAFEIIDAIAEQFLKS